MPLQVNSCVYFTRSEIVALSSHLVFASLPQSLFILLLCPVSGCRPYGLHLLGFLLVKGAQAEDQRARELFITSLPYLLGHLVPGSRGVPPQVSYLSPLQFLLQFPGAIPSPLLSCRPPRPPAATSQQMPCQSLFVPLTLIIPLCVATLLRNLYLYQFVYILFPPEL